MIKTARRNARIVFMALCVPFLLFFAFRHALDGYLPTPATSFILRCGGSYVVWMLACAGCAVIACFDHAYALFYTEFRREKGHALNGLTLSHAAASVACGLVFSLPLLTIASSLWGLPQMPCVITVIFYGVVAVAVGARDLHTRLRTPVLLAVPDVEREALNEEGRRLGRLLDQRVLTPEEQSEYQEFINRCLEMINRQQSSSEGL